MSSNINSLDSVISSSTIQKSIDLFYCVWNDQDYAIRAGDLMSILGREYGASQYATTSGIVTYSAQAIPFDGVAYDSLGFTDSNTPGYFFMPPEVSEVCFELYLDTPDAFTARYVMYRNDSFLIGESVGSESHRPAWVSAKTTVGEHRRWTGPIPVESGDYFYLAWTNKSLGNTIGWTQSCYFNVRALRFR